MSNAKMSSIKTLKQKENNRLTSSKGKKGNVHHRRNQDKEKSFESDDESILHAGKAHTKNTINIENLRPPNVWNFPIDLLHKKVKDEDKKIEIKNADPRNFYRDGRVVKFLELLDKIKTKLIEYCIGKNDEKWKYYFDCVLKTHRISYNYYADMKKKSEDPNEENNVLSQD